MCLCVYVCVSVARRSVCVCVCGLWVLVLLSAAGRYGGPWPPCASAAPQLLFASDRLTPPRSRSAGRSPNQARLSYGVSYKPGMTRTTHRELMLVNKSQINTLYTPVCNNGCVGVCVCCSSPLTWPSLSTGLQILDQKCRAQHRPPEQSLDRRHRSPSRPAGEESAVRL